MAACDEFPGDSALGDESSWESSSGDAENAFHVAAIEEEDADAAETSMTPVDDLEELDLPSAGFVIAVSSAIVPFCAATLVAPRIALASFDCVYGIGSLQVGFGTPMVSPTVAVERIERLDDEPSMAALILSEPIEAIEPAEFATPKRDGCEVQSVAYSYVIKEVSKETSDRSLWSGCLREQPDGWWIAPAQGTPNCHGDLGAAVFDDDGGVLGFVVDATNEGSTCVTAEKIVPLTADSYESGDEAQLL